jgi:hypothetical protein
LKLISFIFLFFLVSKWRKERRAEGDLPKAKISLLSVPLSVERGREEERKRERGGEISTKCLATIEPTVCLSNPLSFAISIVEVDKISLLLFSRKRRKGEEWRMGHRETYQKL